MENERFKKELERKTQDQKRLVSGYMRVPLFLISIPAVVQGIPEAMRHISTSYDQPNCCTTTAEDTTRRCTSSKGKSAFSEKHNCQRI